VADHPAPTPRTLEAALECAVETARTSARNDNGTWFLKAHGNAMLNALRELSAKTAEAERLREALDNLQACTGSILAAHGGTIKNSLRMDAAFARNAALRALAAAEEERSRG